MLKKLQSRLSNPIRVGLVGAGAMGKGIAYQVAHTPGMRLMFIGDLNLEVAKETARQIGKEPIQTDGETIPEIDESQVLVTTNSLGVLRSNDQLKMEAFAEATNAISAACEYCLAAIEGGMHVTLMNAEVDMVYGKLLNHEAKKHGVVVTSDGGDQHGVLATMIDEIKLWGFDIVQAGNIKGFLDYYATPESIRPEAEKRNLSPVQCCAYTDGTKLNIEMALLCNALGLTPFKDGMEGPRCENVTEVLDLFDFDAYEGEGRVDYILGAEPGGGVYVVGKSASEFQRPYLWYYKLLSKGDYYLFYRPYHLCHLETTTAIAKAVFDGEAILEPGGEVIADVYAYAKSDLKAGHRVEHGIGGAECYGLIRNASDAESINQLPISYLEGEGDQLPVLKRDIAKNEPVRYEDVEFPDIQFHHLLKQQSELS